MQCLVVSLSDEVREALEAVERELGVEITADRWRGAAAIPADGSVAVLFHPVDGSWESADGCSLFVPSSVPAVAARTVNGTVVAAVELRCVTAYFPSHSSPPQEWIAALAEAVRASVEPEFARAAEEQREAQQREALEAYARSLHDTAIDARRASIDGYRLNISDYQERIARTMHSLRQEQELLDALLYQRQHDTAARILAEYEQLRDHPRVRSISFETNTLTIVTSDDLRLTRSGTEESRWLGSFRISIDLGSYAVRVRNLSTRRGGRDHPHIVDERPCFGGHQDTFTELLGNGSLYVFFDLLLQYLETLNLEDEYGRFGAYWFEQPDERPLEQEVAA